MYMYTYIYIYIVITGSRDEPEDVTPAHESWRRKV